MEKKLIGSHPQALEHFKDYTDLKSQILFACALGLQHFFHLQIGIKILWHAPLKPSTYLFCLFSNLHLFSVIALIWLMRSASLTTSFIIYRNWVVMQISGLLQNLYQLSWVAYLTKISASTAPKHLTSCYQKFLVVIFSRKRLSTPY